MNRTGHDLSRVWEAAVRKILIVFGTTDGHTRKIADALAIAMRGQARFMRIVLRQAA